MTTDQIITVAILALTFFLLIRTKLPPAAVFLGALTLTMTFKLAPVDQSLKGFANPGMLTVGALFMVAAGMYSTGAITMITEKLIGTPKTLLGAQLKILPPVAIGSAFLNNTPLVAMMVPVIRDLAKVCRLPATKLYIPLSYASILGGTCTLIGTSTNLVIAGMITDAIDADPGGNLQAVGIFDPSWVGVPVMIGGLVFIMLTSRWLLPNPAITSTDLSMRRYYTAEFRIEPGSSLVGLDFDKAGLADPVGFEIIRYTRQDGSDPEIAPQTRVEAGDVIQISCLAEALPGLWATDGVVPKLVSGKLTSQRYKHSLVEVVISRRCSAIGRRYGEFDPEGPYKANIVALSRGGWALPDPIETYEFTAGDILVAEVDDSFFFVNRNEVEFASQRRLTGARIQRRDRATAASLITVGMVTAAAFGWLSMLNAALLASGLMILTGCLPLRQAGRSVEFGTLVVIASAIGLEAAVTGSGLSGLIAGFLGGLGGDNAHIALAAVFLGCIAMDTLITNVASAVFMFPIALAMSRALGLDFMPFAMVLMVGASCSLISPMGYQTNLMVYGPGNYRFVDFARMGVPLTLVVGVITIFLAPVVFPF
jgi:di/tricarboxylate transporter